MKKGFVLGALLASAIGAHAQFGIGAQVNYLKYFAGAPSFFGFGLSGSLVVKESNTLRLSANYALPHSESFDETAIALSSATVPQYVSVQVSESTTLLNFWLDAQHFFGGHEPGDGGVFASAGLGLTLASLSQSMSSFDQSKYTGPDGSSASVSQLGIRVALGYDKAFAFGNMFLEAGLNLSANSANGQEIAVNLPSFLYGNLGVRHWLGGYGGGGGGHHKGSHHSKSKHHGHHH